MGIYTSKTKIESVDDDRVMKFVDTSVKYTPPEADLKYDDNNNDESQSFSEAANISEKESLDVTNGVNKSDRSWEENFTLHLSDDSDKTRNYSTNILLDSNIHYLDKDSKHFAETSDRNQYNSADLRHDRNDDPMINELKKNQGKGSNFPKQSTLSEYFTVSNESFCSESTTPSVKPIDNGLDKMVSLEKLLSQLFTARVVLRRLPETILKSGSPPVPRMSIENIKQELEIKMNKTINGVALPILIPIAKVPIEDSALDHAKAQEKITNETKSIPVLMDPIDKLQPGSITKIGAENVQKLVDKRLIVRRYCKKCERITIDDRNVSNPKNCEDCRIPMLYQCMICNMRRYVHYNHYTRHCMKCINTQKLTEMMVQICSNCNEVSRTIETQKCEKCRKRLFFKCARCPNKYLSFEILLDHVNRNCFMTHGYTNGDYSTSLVKSLEKIMNYKESKKTLKIPKFSCQKCGKMMKNRESLRNHDRFCGTEMISCEFCYFKTKYPRNLKNHIEVIHASGASQDTKLKSTSSAVGTIKGTVLRKVEKTLIIKCEKCKKGFQSSNNFKMHTKVCNSSTRKLS